MLGTILGSIILTACNNGNDQGGTKDKISTSSATDTSKLAGSVKYTCTMHPEVISDTAGHCPTCGMELVPIKDSTKSKPSW
jgi:hypothetical protein